MQLEIIMLAISILVGAILAIWQLRASSREFSKEIGKAVERAIVAIHHDIKASQEKIEKSYERKRLRED